ncbi:CapA family protein [Geobacter sp. SVR]|uniref:CapA family protein n=1 Tax=Geobacter sp. SVR TaxID=2495594 RepID=UPI00143EF929|nr:CapA family protein [Geobacter sp. SVR]BCS55567.1 capsular polysaccharide biosynthesis protein [Geobacter sp. SVR]GCF83570.1 capsular polysaccharide biosynthesis protein [Geobacter sp. SVR]
MKPVAALIITIALHLCTPGLPAAGELVVNAVGDIMLAGRWTPVLKQKGFDYPFGDTLAELATGDINLANLEAPIACGGREFTSKKYRFRADPDLAPALRKAGFHLVTLSNNHSMDFGAEALLETMQHLGKAGMDWIGAGKNLSEARTAVIYTVHGKRIAFLGYSLTQPAEFFAGPQRPGTAPGLERFYAADIARVRNQADFVIVTFHWGTEGSPRARPHQRAAAHRAIDAGADAVIGHHPHVLQGIERYRKGIIFYSLGNFAFASASRTARFGALVRLHLNDAGRQAEIVPLDVLFSRVRFRPRVLSGDRAESVVKTLNDLSKPFETVIQNQGGRYLIDF